MFKLIRSQKPVIARARSARSNLKIATTIAIVSLLAVAANAANLTLKPSRDYREISASVIKKIALPEWYHEGLFFDGKDLWVCNGKSGKVWIVDTSSGAVLSEVTPVGTFTEAISKKSGYEYFLTDWDAVKIYIVTIGADRMVVKAEASFSPAHPAGAVWTGSRLFVITWRRGLGGTKFSLVEMDGEMRILRTIPIKGIEEPSQIAWDGKKLWISSWYSKLVYRIDIDKMEIEGAFHSPADLTTGIAFDGQYLWLTGTYSGLYQMEISEKEADMAIKVTSSAFKEGETIPRKYTCDGDEFSPPLEWSGIPAQAKSIAVISDDPDAPRGTWVHWVIFNIPSSEKCLPEKVSHGKTLPNGARQGLDDSGNVGYGGPCPPSGTHRYYFKVYALDAMLDLPPGIKKKDLVGAMEGHVLAEGQLMGRYKR